MYIGTNIVTIFGEKRQIFGNCIIRIVIHFKLLHLILLFNNIRIN